MKNFLLLTSLMSVTFVVGCNGAESSSSAKSTSSATGSHFACSLFYTTNDGLQSSKFVLVDGQESQKARVSDEVIVPGQKLNASISRYVDAGSKVDSIRLQIVYKDMIIETSAPASAPISYVEAKSSDSASLSPKLYCERQ